MMWLELIGAVIGGGLITKLFDYIRQSRKDSRQNLESDNQLLREEIREHKDEVNELHERLISLQGEIVALRNKIILLESAHMDIPFPLWLKDTDGTMLALNTAYEKAYLIPNGLMASDYVGRHDSDIWDKETAEQFRKNDLWVLRTGRIWDGVEEFKIGDEVQSVRIIKYPRYAGKVKIGIAGMAIPEKL